MEDSAKLRLVRCPKCQNVLPEWSDYSVYRCGSCSTVLQAKEKKPERSKRMYEVFLNFRGEDTRASFISHLYPALKNAGIAVFMDDHSLERGDHISTSLLRSIGESQISVVVFSRNYADSRWCLGELVKIIECWRTIGQVVLPVFYGVDPSEVRHQKGEFGEAFQNLLDRISEDEGKSQDRVRSWREALHEAAGIAGFSVLNSRHFAENGISVLVEQRLVTVDDKNKLGMPHLLRDMGREIIREESAKEPGERSRLWSHEDVLNVLTEQTGTEAVVGLALKLPRANAKCCSTKKFEKMKRLRLLQLAGVQLDGDLKYLSRNLRWLCWNGFPLTCIPPSFYQGNLVSIELENSNVKLVWKETQRLEMLKILNLSHSHRLTHSRFFKLA